MGNTLNCTPTSITIDSNQTYFTCASYVWLLNATIPGQIIMSDDSYALLGTQIINGYTVPTSSYEPPSTNTTRSSSSSGTSSGTSTGSSSGGTSTGGSSGGTSGSSTGTRSSGTSSIITTTEKSKTPKVLIPFCLAYFVILVMLF